VAQLPQQQLLVHHQQVQALQSFMEQIQLSTPLLKPLLAERLAKS
jgi:hypothetical protein